MPPAQMKISIFARLNHILWRALFQAYILCYVYFTAILTYGILTHERYIIGAIAIFDNSTNGCARNF